MLEPKELTEFSLKGIIRASSCCWFTANYDLMLGCSTCVWKRVQRRSLLLLSLIYCLKKPIKMFHNIHAFLLQLREGNRTKVVVSTQNSFAE